MPDREIERLREVEIALVVGRNGHDRARPVVHQHVVGDVDRQPLAVHGVHGMEPRVDSRLRGRSGTLCGLLRRRTPDVVANFVQVDARDELVLRREDKERGAVQRVGSGREDGNVLVELLDPEQSQSLPNGRSSSVGAP